jgi:hypothetical protein
MAAPFPEYGHLELKFGEPRDQPEATESAKLLDQWGSPDLHL